MAQTELQTFRYPIATGGRGGGGAGAGEYLINGLRGGAATSDLGNAKVRF